MELTEWEHGCLADLKSELEDRKGTPMLYKVMNFVEIEVEENSGSESTYYDSENSLTIKSIDELKHFVSQSQRWSFERFLGDEGQLDQFSWDEIEDDDFFDEWFDKFAINQLNLYKLHYQLYPVEVGIFFTLKEAEAYLAEHKDSLHKQASVQSQTVPHSTGTAQLLSMLYRLAESSDAA